jgi:hypothetical protein
MAAPVAAVGIGAAALGSAVSAFGNYQQGQASAAEATYKAGVAQMNQQIAQQNANYALYAGEVEAQQEGIKTSQQIATTKAEQSAGGLDVSSGSNLAVRDSEYSVGQENIAMVRSNAAKRAYGYEVQGVQYGAEATLDKFAATESKISGTTAAIGSLLGGASSVSSKWLSPSNPLS